MKTKALTIIKEKKVRKKKSEIAYVIEDRVFGSFAVIKSANAWWMDKTKIGALINAYKFGATHEEASVATGIPITTLEYFRQIHPEFSGVINACHEVPNLRARQTVVTQIATDGNLAFKYLERKKPGEFGLKPPVTAIQINMGDRMMKIREENR